MSERKQLLRLVAYIGGIVVLMFPLYWLGAPATVSSAGGVLAQSRAANGLGQASQGEVDPASEAGQLMTLGLRGLAVNILWNMATEYKKKEDWTKFAATLDQLTKLQPHFITFWRYQSWNVSYNVSVEFDDFRDRYYYVRRGIEFLKKGQDYNKDNPQLLWDIGWFIGQKIGRADEHVQYRRLFKADGKKAEEVYLKRVRGRGKSQRQLFRQMEATHEWAENYYYELVGLEVVRDDGGRLGTLERIIETGANDVYLVRGAEGEEILIPGTREVVESVDIEGGTMVVKPIPGLLDE